MLTGKQNFVPHPGKQSEFLQSTADWIFFGGARGGSKSFSLTWKAAFMPRKWRYTYQGNEISENEYQELKVDYIYSPPFRILTDEEKNEIINNIVNSEIEILFICLGCPKQEYWMAEHKKYLKCISIGVGEVVDLISNKTKLTPKWIQNIGCEWLFRLILEPKRLWKRYLDIVPKFIFLNIIDIFKRRFYIFDNKK